MAVSYSDPEIRVFHPLCKEALSEALAKLGKRSEYDILHHQYTGSLEMDFVIQNKVTKKYLCVVEVKRTPRDVQSTRCQYQAESYVKMNTAQNEKPFYIITNLEKLISFRYDPLKPRVYQQMLKPGLEHICNFVSDPETDIVNKLSTAFKRIIENFLSDNYDYSTTLEDFLSYMESIILDGKRWKSSMAVLMYEYIRGSFNAIKRSDMKHDVRKFRGDIKSICNEGNGVDFDGIFKYESSKYLPRLTVASNILADIYTFGTVNISGDVIADALHFKISENRHHDGEVATDSELALLASTLAKISNGELETGKKVCDPAAGSGNLICSSVNVFNIDSSSLKANDINTRLIEVLSLRLGLNFPTSINKSNAPSVSTEDLVKLDPSYFGDVDVILLNPPFVSGINCVERKRPFYEKVKEIKGLDALTLSGQTNLGAVFLETVCWMASPGTTIACIFPKAHLTARGDEAVKFRHMLLDLFGSHTIFNYPADDLFETVTEETCIFVGRAHIKSEKILVYSSDEKVANIDLHALQMYSGGFSSADFSTIIHGVEAKEFDWNELKKDVENGWRNICSEMTEATEFITNKVWGNLKLEKILNTVSTYRRGNVGGSGGSDLMFFDTIPELYNKYVGSVSLCEGFHNVKLNDFALFNGDSKFIDFNSLSDTTIAKILNDYFSMPKTTTAQQRKAKSSADLEKIAKRDGKIVFNSNSVLVPTKIRKTGRIYVTRVPMHISTNVSVFTYETPSHANIIASYMTTVFYQLECEVQSKNHAGVRKLELKDVKTTHVPNISLLSAHEIDQINAEIPNIVFTELNNPSIRKIDEIWADILFGSGASKNLLDAQRLLRFLANRRNSPKNCM